MLRTMLMRRRGEGSALSCFELLLLAYAAVCGVGWRS